MRKALPVDIDFGDVTMAMRDLLRRMGKKPFRPAAAAANFFLAATHPNTIKIARSAMIGVGFRAQRLANRLLKPVARAQTRMPPATVGKPKMVEQVVHFVNKRMPGGLPKKTARALLDIEDRSYIPHHPGPQANHARQRGGVLLSGLRIRAPVFASRTRDTGNAVASGSANGPAPRLPLLRVSAAWQRRSGQGRPDLHREPRAVSSRSQHTELSRHQDRGGQLRNLLRPVGRL